MNNYNDSKKSYTEIFNQRGLDYHKAMLLLPNARDNEFKNIISEFNIVPQMTIVDMPSGGNYLKNYLPENVSIVPLETSEIFAKLGGTQVCQWSSLPLDSNSVDVVLCCAAFHHVEPDDRLKFREEVTRILKPNGKLVIADVQVGTAVDAYLNTFVNENNSMGHLGWFLDDSFGSNYQTNSLILKSNKVKEFPWYFTDDLELSMTYMKLLFGIDKASTKQIVAYLKDHLGLKKTDENIFMINWCLRYVTFSKKE
jgi:SAM-dependent methyltransferase